MLRKLKRRWTWFWYEMPMGWYYYTPVGTCIDLVVKLVIVVGLLALLHALYPLW